MEFRLGKPIAVLIVLAVASGVVTLLYPARPHSDLTVWVFAQSHADEYRSIAPEFHEQTGKSFRVDLITAAALNVRLSSLFMSPRTAGELPDATEVEFGSVARYFRAPVASIGFLPLNHYLETSGFREISSLNVPGKPGWNARLTTDGKVYTHDGRIWRYNPTRLRPDAWIDRIAQSRLAAWSKDGVIFGVPHDVHPVTITYRADLFEQAGVDLPSATTWSQFQQDCLAFQRYWQARGARYRHAMQLSDSNCEDLMQMLLQRHLPLIDEQERVRINEPQVAQTLAFYSRLVAGPDAIGTSSSSTSELWAQDLTSGSICALFTPDWKTQYVRQYADLCAAKLRMMPLPRFEPSDAPTSTWGGTMIGIPRSCKHPDAAWKLIEYLYFSPTGLEARRTEAAILPPIPEEWDNPAYHRPDPFFGGQDVMGLYAELARQIPANAVTPATPLAQGELSFVVTRAIAYMRSYGTAGLEQACQKWLDDAADDIRRRIRQGRFDNDDTARAAPKATPSGI